MQIPLDIEYAGGLIQPHETWSVTDASKMEEFRRCPRRYFWMYVLGWMPEGPKSHHLIVGKSLHKAMEVVCNTRIPEDPEGIRDLAVVAIAEYEKELRKTYPPETDEGMGAKSFGNVAAGIMEYLVQHKGEKLDVVYTEVAGVVPVCADPPRWMHFVIDLIVKDEQGITVWDHKTGSRLDDLWTSQFYLRPQLALYTHVLYCLPYEPDEVFGALVNGFIFRKKENAFIRIPIRYTVEQIEGHLWDMNRHLDMLEVNFEDLTKCRDTDECMMAFPRNDRGCSAYGRLCAYHDFCTVWPNPLKRIRQIPPGFKVYFWDPRSAEKEAKEVWRMTEKEGQYKEEKEDERE
jgi:hypothetical protein